LVALSPEAALPKEEAASREVAFLLRCHTLTARSTMPVAAGPVVAGIEGTTKRNLLGPHGTANRKPDGSDVPSPAKYPDQLAGKTEAPRD